MYFSGILHTRMRSIKHLIAIPGYLSTHSFSCIYTPKQMFLDFFPVRCKAHGKWFFEIFGIKNLAWLVFYKYKKYNVFRASGHGSVPQNNQQHFKFIVSNDIFHLYVIQPRTPNSASPLERDNVVMGTNRMILPISARKKQCLSSLIQLHDIFVPR